MDEVVRTRLSDRYELREVIGRGGMGVVHRAWDARLQRPVAVKVLHERATDPISRARFRAEGTTLAGLSHPGLITLYDAATDADEPYLVMELVEGQPLNAMTGAPLSPDLVTGLGAALAEALDHVHRHRVVHRDVKPSNVLVEHGGRVKLADFGVARLLDNFTQQTETGTTVGTAAYLSPEQVRGEVATPAADVYSLGLVLIEALSGAAAFSGPREAVAIARLTTPPQIGDGVPAPLRELVVEMTALDPARRPTAAEVGSELRRMAVTRPEPRTSPEPEPGLTRRRPRVMTVVLTTAVLLVTGFAVRQALSSSLGTSGPHPGSATASTSISNAARWEATPRTSTAPLPAAPTHFSSSRAVSPAAKSAAPTSAGSTPAEPTPAEPTPAEQSKTEAKQARAEARAEAKAERKAQKQARKNGGDS